MKKVIKFSKLFLPCAIGSTVIILSGIVGLFTKGINYGIDFQAGFIEKVTIAPTALSLSYSGAQSVTVDQSSTKLDFVITGVADDNKTVSFPYAEYPTVGAFTSAIAAVPGVSINVSAPADTALKSVFPDSGTLNRLSATPYRFHYIPAGSGVISTDDVRAAISVYPEASVQVVGKPEDRTFQIRVSDDGKTENALVTFRAGISAALSAVYGADNIAIVSTDFVGSRLSQSMATSATWLCLLTLLLIWAYCAIRFRWDFAVGGVLAILHDALMIITFVVWTGMQFNSTTIAAILTILGYSINDTVVIFDRIRENLKFHPEMKITDILDLSQTEVLSRTVITTVTTMLAVLSLYLFTSGDMKAFALALLVGMTSGVYSTIYIASAFISMVGHFRKDGGRMAEKVKAAKPVISGELV
jgi:preprotein translocase subunit SecF